VRFSRLGLAEEYSISVDGVQQDFIMEQPPSNPLAGELVVAMRLVSQRRRHPSRFSHVGNPIRQRQRPTVRKADGQTGSRNSVWPLGIAQWLFFQ